MKYLISLFALLFALPAWGDPACVNPTFATVTPQVVASGTSGVAPLLVCFDATGTTTTETGVDPLTDIDYNFTFEGSGDDCVANSRTWGQGSPANVSKCSQRSNLPIGCHVYEESGVYSQGTLVATTPAGVSATYQLPTISVNSPDAVFAGAATTCVRNDTHDPNDPNDPACPGSGTTLENTSSFDDAYDSATDSAGSLEGRRFLLRCGDTFSSDQGIKVNTTPGDGKHDPAVIGAYPRRCANRPVVNAQGDAIRIGRTDVETIGLRIEDLVLVGDGNDVGFESGIDTRCWGTASICAKWVIRNVSSSGFWMNFLIGNEATQFFTPEQQFRELALIDSTGFDSTMADNSHGRSLSASLGVYHLIGGNNFYNAKGHIVRSGIAQKGVWIANRIAGTTECSICNGIKLHAPKWQVNTNIGGGTVNQFTTFQHTEFIGFLRNVFDANGETQMGGLLATGAQNQISDERLRYLYVQHNFFDRDGATGGICYNLAADDVVISGNIFDVNGGTRAVNPSGYPFDAKAGVDIFQNTVYSGGSGNAVLANVTGGAADISGVDCRNNAIVAPGGTATVDENNMCDTDSDNVTSTAASGVFTTEPPVAVADYVPVAAALIDAGDETVPAYVDAEGTAFTRTAAEMEIGALDE